MAIWQATLTAVACPQSCPLSADTWPLLTVHDRLNSSNINDPGVDNRIQVPVAERLWGFESPLSQWVTSVEVAFF